MSRIRLTILVLATATAGCTNGYRGIGNLHQPVVGAAGAYVPGCPDWRDGRLPPGEGQSSNYGCATMTNFAAMVADPEDLLRGRSADTSSPEVAGKAIKAWREAEPTSKSWTPTVRESVSGAGR